MIIFFACGQKAFIALDTDKSGHFNRSEFHKGLASIGWYSLVFFVSKHLLSYKSVDNSHLQVTCLLSICVSSEVNFQKKCLHLQGHKCM